MRAVAHESFLTRCVIKLKMRNISTWRLLILVIIATDVNTVDTSHTDCFVTSIIVTSSFLPAEAQTHIALRSVESCQLRKESKLHPSCLKYPSHFCPPFCDLRIKIERTRSARNFNNALSSVYFHGERNRLVAWKSPACSIFCSIRHRDPLRRIAGRRMICTEKLLFGRGATRRGLRQTGSLCTIANRLSKCAVSSKYTYIRGQPLS